MTFSDDAPLEHSAGGVVFNEKNEILLIIPVRRAGNGAKVTGLPKGHPEPGESLQQAAQREVREETGVDVEILDFLGETNYWYVRDGRKIPKRVSWFAARYLKGSTADHDDEIEAVSWVPIDQAKECVTYRGERTIIERAVQFLQ